MESSVTSSLLDILLTGGRNRPFNPSVDMNQFLYCSIIDSLPLGCMSQNLLEMWKFNELQLKSLTKDDIINTLHSTRISPITGHETNFSQLLGGIKRNRTGHIVAATSLLTNWMVYVNFTEVDHSKIGNAAGTEDWVIWQGFLEKILKLNWLAPWFSGVWGGFAVGKCMASSNGHITSYN